MSCLSALELSYKLYILGNRSHSYMFFNIEPPKHRLSHIHNCVLCRTMQMVNAMNFNVIRSFTTCIQWCITKCICCTPHSPYGKDVSPNHLLRCLLFRKRMFIVVLIAKLQFRKSSGLTGPKRYLPKKNLPSEKIDFLHRIFSGCTPKMAPNWQHRQPTSPQPHIGGAGRAR